jgi:hypothetical protein
MQLASVTVGIARAIAAGTPAQLAELQVLRERCAMFEAVLGVRHAMLFPMRMRPQARVIFGILLTRDAVSAEALFTALYAARAEADWPGDPANVIKQQIYYLRRKIEPFAVIETIKPLVPTDPLFYRLTPESKAWALALIAARGGKVVS